MEVKCSVCEEVFNTLDDAKKVCSAKCRQKKYRMSARGKGRVREYNQRYKREEKEWECCVCGGVIMSARRRIICDSCIETGKKVGYKNPGMAVSMAMWRERNPDKYMSYSKTSSMVRMIARGTMEVVCEVCGSGNKVQLHHHNYTEDKAKDVIPLCRSHHNEIHSWDSN
jgi:hypothetical protein